MRSELYDKRGDIGAFFATLASEITKIGLINGVRPPGILIRETLRDSYYSYHSIPVGRRSSTPPAVTLCLLYSFASFTFTSGWYCVSKRVFPFDVLRLWKEFCFSFSVFGIVSFCHDDTLDRFYFFVSSFKSKLHIYFRKS